MADDPEPRGRQRRKRQESRTPRGRRICRLQSAKNVIDHAVLCELREHDLSREWHEDGAKSGAQWVSWYLGVKLGTAYERLRVAHELAKRPILDEAMRNGEVSYTQARAITRLPLPDCDQELLNLCRRHSGEELEQGIRQVRQRAVADTLPIQPRALRATFEDLGDGSTILRAHLRPEGAATVKRTLQGIKQQNDPNLPNSMSDAEAFEVMANRAARVLDGEDPRSVSHRYEVMLLVSAEALGSTDGNRPPMTRCELDDGTQISVDRARMIACDSPVRALLMRQDGTPLDVGRRTSKVSKRLRKTLIARDRHCTFPGCTSRLGLDAHHIEHWIDGGETKESNLTLLCRPHHGEVHDKHYRLVRGPDGVEFHGSDGLVLPRGPSVPRFSSELPTKIEDDIFERHPVLRGALRLAVDEWVARSRGSAA